MDVDNNAISIAEEWIAPFFNPAGIEIFRSVREDSPAYIRDLYDRVWLPYQREVKSLHDLSHNFIRNTDWCGEKSFSTMVSAINQRAWWLIHYYFIVNTVEDNRGRKLSGEELGRISISTCKIIDDEAELRIILQGLLKDLGISSKAGIYEKIEYQFENYRKTKSTPVIFR